MDDTRKKQMWEAYSRYIDSKDARNSSRVVIEIMKETMDDVYHTARRLALKGDMDAN